jgi:hypothetical protein
MISTAFDLNSLPYLCSQVFAAHALQHLDILIFSGTHHDNNIISKQLNYLESRVTMTFEVQFTLQVGLSTFSILSERKTFL